MNIWVIIISVAAGATISECYHARMWKRYQQGKSEGLRTRQQISDARRGASFDR